jgi:3-isopropylmalate dehydrogenase
MSGMGKSYDIAVIPGDGTGPEVVREGLKVLKAAASIYGVDLSLKEYDFGGERYKKTGELLPDSAIAELKQFDSIYLGAIGHPDVEPGILERGIVLKARFALDQYINLRPVKLFPGVESPLKDKTPADIDYVVVRENTEGFYAGSGGSFKVGTLDEVAIQSAIVTRKGVERCLRYAFELARKRNKRLTLAGKTNVMTYAFGLWARVFDEIGEKDYQDIKRDYGHVDAICMWMIKNPEWFDVIVTENMFGDIISDIGAITQGGLGIAAGGNINPEGVSMFESIGGSAPKYTGQNVINPIASICSVAMMMDSLGQQAMSNAINDAVMRTTPRLKSLSAGKMGYSTSEVGDLIVAALKSKA